MTTLSAHTSRAIHNKGMQAVYGIAAEFDVPVEDVIALLGTTSNPSKTGVPSLFVRLESTTQWQPVSSKVTAADTSTAPPVDETTDGAGLSSSQPTAPSVDPIHVTNEDEVLAAEGMRPGEEYVPKPSPLPGDPAGEVGLTLSEETSPAAFSSPAEPVAKPMTRADLIRADLAEHPNSTAAEIAARLGMDVHPVRSTARMCNIPVRKLTPDEVKATQSQLKKQSINTDATRVLAAHAANPGWTARMIGKALGITPQRVTALAGSRSIKLVSQPDYDAAQVKARTQELAASLPPTYQPGQEQPPATIPAAEIDAPTKRVPLGKRIAVYVAEHPAATLKDVSEAIGATMQSTGWAAKKAGIELRKYTAEERSEATSRGIQARKAKAPAEPPRSLMPRADAIQPDETVMSDPQALRTYRPAQTTSARFYLRDKAGHFLHMSLEASPTDDGPLMTKNRAYAWVDNAQRYRGALKLWPEIAELRKEGAGK